MKFSDSLILWSIAQNFHLTDTSHLCHNGDSYLAIINGVTMYTSPYFSTVHSHDDAHFDTVKISAAVPPCEASKGRIHQSNIPDRS